ncbi:hypothetical protein R1sor_012786 [Riccia sorocarpa]|uniref:ASCH domain-containing protein n=1 Tax=Riccia sorocarpa TaxID=122646 RepID=A0ABD3I8C3_9MARC
MVEPGKACLTLHQPWASLLVCGIKRIEGRSWPCPIRGKLWIHAASKVPEPETIKAMETFYRELYGLDGVTEIKFPEFYPTSVLLGCVEVVECLKLEELNSWEEVSVGVRLEGQTDYCWLCERPQKLVVPLQMRGRQGVYSLPKSILEGASRALKPISGPAPFTFPTWTPPIEASPAKPEGQSRGSNGKAKGSKSAALEASIAGARQAALQFRRQEIRNLKQQEEALERPRPVNRNKSPHRESSDSSASSSPSETAEVRWGASASPSVREPAEVSWGSSGSSSQKARASHMELVKPTSRILTQALRASSGR